MTRAFIRFAAVACFGCAAASAASGAELTFHAPFDGTAEAAVAKGKAAPLTAKGLEFVPGKVGKAVRITAAARSRLSYAMEGNLDGRSGAIAVWFKREWGKGREGNWRFILSNPVGRPRVGTGALMLWWITASLRADVSDCKDRFLMGPAAPKEGEWMHIVWCWNDREQWYYVNGRSPGAFGDSDSPLKRFGRPKFAFERRKFDSFDVGSRNGEMQADGLLDDLRIYSAPITGDEALAIVEAAGGIGHSASGRRDWKKVLGLPKKNPYVGETAVAAGEFRPEELELLEEVRLDTPGAVAGLRAADRFCSVGEAVFGELGGTGYIETARKTNDRWALRLKVDRASPIHVIDIDYPDNAPRTMDVVIQTTKGDRGNYTMQTGVACGGEYASTGRILTHRCIYWTVDEDVSLVVMTPRKDFPAAVSAVRVYRVKDGRLPVAKLSLPPPVNGWRRSLGLFFEDPAIGFDFAVERDGYTDKGLSELIDRTAALMKFTGENLFAYPGAWYHGVIGGKSGYNPRTHAPDFLSAWYTKFDAEGLSVVPTLNMLTVGIPREMITEAGLKDGSLHPTCVAILSDGLPNTKGWHGTPAAFNFYHPDTQRYIEDAVDVLLEQGKAHESFKGLCLHLSRHSFLSWGGLDSGYNDYCIDAFEKAKGVKVPCDRNDPLRGKAYAGWILANAKEEWLEWRSDVFTEFWAKMAAKLRAARPDLKLWISCFTTSWVKHGKFLDPGFIGISNREYGVDSAKLEKAVPNLILAQGIVPADYRYRATGWKQAEKERQLGLATDRRTFDSLEGVSFPWIGHHDRYWESPVGRRKGSVAFGCKWFKECGWRVVTVNPSGYHALRHFTEPLRYHDVLGMSKGGFLIGTYGMEAHLAKFAQAYLALPAVKMEECYRSGVVVGRRTECFGKTYGYVVNTGPDPVTVRPGFHKGSSDCVTGRILPAALRLGPYELVSFVR